MNPGAEWHTEARFLYARNMRIEEIMSRFGKSRSAVRWAIGMDSRSKTAKPHRANPEKKLSGGARKRSAKTDAMIYSGVDGSFVRKWSSKAPRQLIDREALAKILSEKRGDISVKELMEAISL